MSQYVEFYRIKVDTNFYSYMDKKVKICYNFCITKEKVENCLLSLFIIIREGEIMKNNNIYLMDKPIDDISKDEFDHKCLVDEIVNNIKNNNPPYNIALVGKWGTGKSSILDCVQRELENEKDSTYLITKINAWKYEKQELRKSFILEILGKLPHSNKNERSLINQIKEVLDNALQINGEETNENLTINWKKILKEVTEKLLVIFIPILIMFIAFLIITDIVLNIKNVMITDYNGIRLDICGSFAVAILIEIIALFKDAIDSKKIFNITVKENTKDSNFYEEQMKKAIEGYKKKNKKFKALVCIVEDIDRLNADKMVEAISALKSFIGIDDIIFIVPYDTNILSTVLEKCKNNKISGNYEVLEGELVLNKLFQFKVYMPELIQEDMYEYTKNIIEKEYSEIYSLFNNNKKIVLDDILPILMYEGVKTPRDAKQILNSFIIKYNIAVGREVIDRNNIEKNEIKMLAVLTVLENDFNEFYSYILMYPTIIDDFLETEKLDKKDNKIYKTFKNSIYKGRKFEALLGFLNYTTTIKIENVERFIYLNDSKIDKVSGGKLGKEFRLAITSFDVKNAKKAVENISNITDMVNREISYNSGNVLKKKNIILTLISIYSIITSDSDKNNIRNIIEKNIENIEKSDYSNLNTTELLNIALDDKEKQCKKTIEVLRQKIDNWIPVYVYYQDENTDLIDEKNILEEELDMYINSYQYLDEETQVKISNLLSKIGEYSRTEDDAANKYNVYTFVDYYNFLKTRINDENYYIVEDNFLNRVMSYVKDEKIELEELEVLKDIYIKNGKFDIYVDSLITTLKNKKAEKILECLKTLQDNLSETKVELKKIIFKIIEDNSTDLLKLDDSEDLDNILEKIIVDILKNDDNNDVDALLMKMNEKIYLIDTINKIATNNMLEKVPNTIFAINQEIIDKKDTEYSEMFEKINNRYTLEEKEDMLNKLYQAIPNVENDINKIKDIFKLLNIKNNREICESFIKKVVNYLKANYTSLTDKTVRNELLVFVSDNINFLEKTEKENYFDFINQKVYTTDINISIKCSSNANFDDLDDSKWKNIIEKYITSTKLKLMDFIHVIVKHSNILADNIDLKEQFIDRVINEFEPNDEIINVLQVINVCEDNNIIKIYDLFSEYVDNHKVVDCMKNLLNNLENISEIVERIIKKNSDITLLLQVSRQNKKIEMESIIKTIIEKYKADNENYELSSKIKILKVIAGIFNGNKKFKEDFILLSTDIVNNIDSTDVDEVIEILIENKKILDKDTKKTLIDKLEVTIEKMDNKDELIKKLEQLK